MNVFPTSIRTLALLSILLVFDFSIFSISSADEPAASTSRVDDTIASIGLDGHYRVGRWTGIRLKQTGSSQTIVETRDGDGVRVQFSNRSLPSGPSDWVYVLPGSEAAPLIVMRDDTVVATRRLATVGSPSRGPAMLTDETPWTLVFGDALGVDKIGENELLRRDATVAVSNPQDASELPDAAIGYDAVDMMLVTSSGRDVLSKLNTLQSQAIVDWVHGGGRIMLTLGESAPKLLAAAPWLEKLLPFDTAAKVSINPSAVETYTSSQTPLKSFDGVKLPRDKGQVLIMGRTTRRVIAPIASQFNVGFGSVVVVAADLEREPFKDWPERFDFVTAMAGPSILPPDINDQPKSQSTAYNDLSGQVRRTLDQFSVRHRASFSVIALILMALIAVIGPLDYLLINRLLGRPLLGWISFPLAAISLSAFLAWQALPPNSKDADTPSSGGKSAPLLQCNRMEFVDIDGAGSVRNGRGQSVNFLFSHDAQRFDIRFPADQKMNGIAKDLQSNAAAFGYPGESFGGIQIALEDTRLPAYQASSDFQTQSDQPLLAGLPLAPRSSKGFLHEFVFSTSVGSEVQLERRPGSELLQGELVNPLPFDLLDGMLIFRNWVYLLPTRFVSGGRVASLDSLRQKNFRWLLSRQKAIESSIQNEAWDTSGAADIRRLAEVLMFHEAVGGTKYTQLKHEPMKHLDLSTTLAEDRCILLGRVESPLMSVSVSTDSSSNSSLDPFVPPGDSLSMLRLILPVAAEKTR